MRTFRPEVASRPHLPPPARGRCGSRRSGGFSLFELLVVLLVISLALAVASGAYRHYLERTAAKRAAETFGRDLALTRTTALRDRAPASLVFFGEGRSYLIRRTSGEVVARRRYGGAGSDIRLSRMEIQLPGDSVTFNARGVADLSGSDGSLGVARFQTGTVTFQVRFNSMGAAEVAERP